MVLYQYNGTRFSRSCRLSLPTRSTLIVRSTTTPGSPPVTEQTSQSPGIVEYNGQKPVARLAKDGSIEEASEVAGTLTEGNQEPSTPAIVRRAQEAASDLFLPTGYPDTLTPDYLEYQLWALPVHVTGWVANSLATSSMLKAAGLGSSAAGAVAAGAAIKWITKDGIGALGRVLVGGGLARFFDEDPRFWRFWADVVKCFGQALEVATPLYPDMFIVLAGAGNLTKAAGRGISRPAFRVIQQHFATGGNVGDVAAREEVWEVAGQLAGLALSVAILQALDADGVDSALLVSPAVAVIVLWLTAQVSHIFLRYKSLSVLQLPWISQARAITLAHAYVSEEALPSVQQLSIQESFATPKEFLQPRIATNATLKDLEAAAERLFTSHYAESSESSGSRDGSAALGLDLNSNGASSDTTATAENRTEARSPGNRELNGASVDSSAAGSSYSEGGSALQQALALYSEEDYVLLPCDGHGEAFVMGVKYTCAEHSMSKAQAVLQAVWYSVRRPDFPGGAAGDFEALTASLQYMHANTSDFEQDLRVKGWQTDNVLMCSQSKAILRVV